MLCHARLVLTYVCTAATITMAMHATQEQTKARIKRVHNPLYEGSHEVNQHGFYASGVPSHWDPRNATDSILGPEGDSYSHLHKQRNTTDSTLRSEGEYSHLNKHLLHRSQAGAVRMPSGEVGSGWQPTLFLPIKLHRFTYHTNTTPPHTS